MKSFSPGEKVAMYSSTDEGHYRGCAETASLGNMVPHPTASTQPRFRGSENKLTQLPEGEGLQFAGNAAARLTSTLLPARSISTAVNYLFALSRRGVRCVSL